MEYRLVNNPNGMVDKKVFLEGMKELRYMFPTWKIDLSNSEVMTLLYKHLGYCRDDVFIKGIEEYIKKQTMNPTVAGLNSYLKSRDSRSEGRSINYYDNHGNTTQSHIITFENGISIDTEKNVVIVSTDTGEYFTKKEIPFAEAKDIIEEVTTLAERRNVH